jgi:hypothetical protein
MDLTKLFRALAGIPFKVYPFVVTIFVLIYYESTINKYLNKQMDKPPLNIKETSMQQKVVLDALDALRELADADRAYILQFHNGTYIFNEGHQLKYSMTFECKNENIQPLHDKYQNVPTSIYAWYFDQVWSEKARWANVDEIDNFPAREGFKDINTKAHLAVPCYRDGQPVAIVCFGWVNRSPEPETILENFELDIWDSDILFNTLKDYSNDITNQLPLNP